MTSVRQLSCTLLLLAGTSPSRADDEFSRVVDWNLDDLRTPYSSLHEAAAGALTAAGVAALPKLHRALATMREGATDDRLQEAASRVASVIARIDAMVVRNCDQAETLVEDLGDYNFDVREAAFRQILELGPSAIGPLREARRSADPEIRVRAELLRKRLAVKVRGRFRLALQILDAVGDARAGITLGEERPINILRTSFSCFNTRYIHYAPDYEVGTYLESADDEPFELFKGAGRLGGNADRLTWQAVAALDANDGIIGLSKTDGHIQYTPLREITSALPLHCLIFTIPKNETGRCWKAYAVVSPDDRFASDDLPEQPSLKPNSTGTEH